MYHKTVPYVREVIPHIFVADNESPFPHSTLKPFNGHQEKGMQNQIFNHHLSCTHWVAGNVFGNLQSVFYFTNLCYYSCRRLESWM